jgi:hypothetical protein
VAFPFSSLQQLAAPFASGHTVFVPQPTPHSRSTYLSGSSTTLVTLLTFYIILSHALTLNRNKLFQEQA